MYSLMPSLCPHEISQLGGIDENINDNHELPGPEGTKKENSNKYKKQWNKNN